MKKLFFASQNKNKLIEIRAKLPVEFLISDLTEFNLTSEIPETGSTLEENALQKARFIYDRFKVDCFADDTGLEVEALGNAPGVYSARYAGEPKNNLNNMAKLLTNLADKSNRKARFRTVIALIKDGKEYLFEGIIQGEITLAQKGTDGFGYDPIFKAEGYEKTFAELSLEEKNKISHRAIAIEKLVAFLKEDK